MPALEKNKRYTYQDYCQWGEDERWEIINGVPYNMAPAPNTNHQRLVLWLGRKIGNELEGKKCQLFLSPFDVIFSDEDVVQPDLFVVCNPEKITGKNIQGAPDLIIEILSPSSNKRDRWDKKLLYETHAVKEYIIVDVDGKYSEQYILQDNGKFNSGRDIGFDEPLTFSLISELSLNLEDALDIPPFNTPNSD